MAALLATSAARATAVAEVPILPAVSRAKNSSGSGRCCGPISITASGWWRKLTGSGQSVAGTGPAACGAGCGTLPSQSAAPPCARLSVAGRACSPCTSDGLTQSGLARRARRCSEAKPMRAGGLRNQCRQRSSQAASRCLPLLADHLHHSLSPASLPPEARQAAMPTRDHSSQGRSGLGICASAEAMSSGFAAASGLDRGAGDGASGLPWPSGRASSSRSAATSQIGLSSSGAPGSRCPLTVT